MTSDPTVANGEAYVWIWLPGQSTPVVAGLITKEGPVYAFNYGRSYLERADAIPIYLPELPLQVGIQAPDLPLDMAGCLRDGAPDAWGRRVIINRLTGLIGEEANSVELDELTFMLNSSSDRIGALDFQTSAKNYEPREQGTATLEELLHAAELVDKGQAIPKALEQALFHGSAIGGARPKAMIDDGGKKYIAKFSSANDTYPVVKAEFIAMRLAELSGLNVAPVRLARSNGKDVLLVQRFDRELQDQRWTRRSMVSALTMFGFGEMEARYASYPELAEIVRKRFTDPKPTLRELFARMAFNVLVGNSDDHARNHAAFWDGEYLSLTPAYDICPQSRMGREANQAMIIHQDNRDSRLITVLQAAPSFHLSEDEARGVIDGLVEIIQSKWDDVCAAASIGDAEKAALMGRQFLNDYAFEGYANGSAQR